MIAQEANEHKHWIDALQAALNATKLDAVYHNSASSDETVIQTMEGILDPCIIADMNCDIVGWNKAAQGIFGYSKDEVLGKNVSLLMPEKYGLFHTTYVSKYHKSGQKKLIGTLKMFLKQFLTLLLLPGMPRTLHGKHKDGSLFSVTLSLGEAPNKSGESRCAFVAVCRKKEAAPPQNSSAQSDVASVNDDNMSKGSRDSGSSKIAFLISAEKNMLEYTEIHLGKYMTSLQTEFEELRKNGEMMKHKLKVILLIFLFMILWLFTGNGSGK